MDEAHRPSPANEGYAGYFEEFLPSILGQSLIDGLDSLTACLEIEVTDGKDLPWRLGIESGRLTYVGHEGPDPVCRFTLDSATLLEVVAAGCSPQEAFFEMRIEIKGDIEMGLRLSTVLVPFFKRFPYAI